MYIIINADDFGASKEINEAIIHCHTNGILSSASLIAKGRAFDHAVKLICNNKRLGVGVHLALDGDYNFTQIPNSIINQENGSFFDNKEILHRIRTCRIKKKDLVREYKQQVEYVLDHNIKITHLDHHHHYHLYKNVLDAVIDVAHEYKIRYIRSQKLISLNRYSYLKLFYRAIHQIYLRWRYQAIDGYYYFRSKDIEAMGQELKQLLQLRFNIIEIMVHPAELNDPESIFLTRDDTKQILAEARIINYGSLEGY